MTLAIPHPSGIPYITRKLHAAPLTIEARSIHSFFSYLAEPEFIQTQTVWVVDIRVDDIAEQCFRFTYPHAGLGSLRRKVCAAIFELEHYSMIAKVSTGEFGKFNRYYLLSSELWNFSTPLPAGNHNIRRSRVRSVDLTAIDTPPRSPEDHSLCLNNIERESTQKVEKNSPPTAVEKQPAQPPNLAVSSIPDQAIDTPIFPSDDSSSSAPKLTAENFQVFNFRQFEFGEAGSHPAFSNWLLQWAKAQQKKRQQSHNPIRRLDEWLFAILLNNGRDYFRDYLREIGELSANPAVEKLTQEQAEWQRAGQKHDRLYRQGKIDQLYECLNRLTGAVPNCVHNPEKLRWLLQRHPDWGFSFSQGVLLRAHLPPASADSQLEPLEPHDLLNNFLKLAEQGLQDRSPQDAGLGLAGLRTLWQEGCQQAIATIRDWAERWRSCVGLSEQGPQLLGEAT